MGHSHMRRARICLRQALHTALDYYTRAFSEPFKPYRDADALYNMATALALVGESQVCRCGSGMAGR